MLNIILINTEIFLKSHRALTKSKQLQLVTLRLQVEKWKTLHRRNDKIKKVRDLKFLYHFVGRVVRCLGQLSGGRAVGRHGGGGTSARLRLLKSIRGARLKNGRCSWCTKCSLIHSTCASLLVIWRRVLLCWVKNHTKYTMHHFRGAADNNWLALSVSLVAPAVVTTGNLPVKSRIHEPLFFLFELI